ncbi:retrotransposon protein putative unclassified, partial [Trifolium medium]|nr:retrotransposon protein putative unclassified [Trifolium medium]
MVIQEEDWRRPIIRYLQEDELPRDKSEAMRTKKLAAWYTMMGDKLYKRGFSAPMLLC